jgi:adenylate cyclase
MDQTTRELHATVLYTAVRDYTRIVNILDLKETHAFLSDCTDVVTRAAVPNRGSLANVMGDQLYFVFGDPKAEFDNPKNAVKCALAIQNTADEISIRWRHALNFLVEVDVGISTGNIVVSNLGPTPKNQYTLIGKNATLATELGRLCKAHNVNILLDTATYDNSKNYFTFRKVGNRPILGFTERIDLYTPLSGLT